MDTVIRSSSSLQDASVSGPDLQRQREHFTPRVRTSCCLNGTQQLREPSQNLCSRSRTAGILFTEISGFWGRFLKHPSQCCRACWSICPAVSQCALAERICAVQHRHSSVPELRGRLGHPAGAGCPAAPGRGCRQAVPWDWRCARPSAPWQLGLSLPQT